MPGHLVCSSAGNDNAQPAEACPSPDKFSNLRSLAARIIEGVEQVVRLHTVRGLGGIAWTGDPRPSYKFAPRRSIDRNTGTHMAKDEGA